MPSPDQPSRAEWLQEAPFTLAMSAGYLDFYSHAGVVEALDERGITPAEVRGASAGGVLAALKAAGVEPGKTVEQLSALTVRRFLDMSPRAGLLSARRIVQLYREILPVTEFDECDTKAYLSVFDLYSRSAEAISQGDLPTAMHGTSALPFLVPPAMINRRPKFDGGIGDWAGLVGTDPNERIFYHHRPPRESKFLALINAEDPSLSFPNLMKFEIAGLPQLTLSTLHRGVEVYRQAKSAALEALDRPAGEMNAA